MPADFGVPSAGQGGTPRHRLVPREKLAAAYEERWGSATVSEYGLAVRDIVENHPEIGPVDTWHKLAERMFRNKPLRGQTAAWRKRFSRHFTAESKGPPWQTVVRVVESVVPDADRRATRERLARLYEAARGEPPPTGDGDATDRDRRHDGRPAQTQPDERTATLHRRIAILERRVAASETEKDQLVVENDRLTAELDQMRSDNTAG